MRQSGTPARLSRIASTTGEAIAACRTLLALSLRRQSQQAIPYGFFLEIAETGPTGNFLEGTPATQTTLASVIQLAALLAGRRNHVAHAITPPPDSGRMPAGLRRERKGKAALRQTWVNRARPEMLKEKCMRTQSVTRGTALTRHAGPGTRNTDDMITTTQHDMVI